MLLGFFALLSPFMYLRKKPPQQFLHWHQPDIDFPIMLKQAINAFRAISEGVSQRAI